MRARDRAGSGGVGAGEEDGGGVGQEKRMEVEVGGCCSGVGAVCSGGVGFEGRLGAVVDAEIVSFGRN